MNTNTNTTINFILTEQNTTVINRIAANVGEHITHEDIPVAINNMSEVNWFNKTKTLQIVSPHYNAFITKSTIFFYPKKVGAKFPCQQIKLNVKNVVQHMKATHVDKITLPEINTIINQSFDIDSFMGAEIKENIKIALMNSQASILYKLLTKEEEQTFGALAGVIETKQESSKDYNYQRLLSIASVWMMQCFESPDEGFAPQDVEVTQIKLDIPKKVKKKTETKSTTSTTNEKTKTDDTDTVEETTDQAQVETEKNIETETELTADQKKLLEATV